MDVTAGAPDQGHVDQTPEQVFGRQGGIVVGDVHLGRRVGLVGLWGGGEEELAQEVVGRLGQVAVDG